MDSMSNMRAVASHTTAASAAPSLTAWAASLTVPTKETLALDCLVRSRRASHGPPAPRARLAALPTAVNSGLGRATVTSGRRRSAGAAILRGLPAWTAMTTCCRATGRISATSPRARAWRT